MPPSGSLVPHARLFDACIVFGPLKPLVSFMLTSVWRSESELPATFRKCWLNNDIEHQYQKCLTMPNALTRHVSLKAGPWFLETLVKHYFERVFHDMKKSGEHGDANATMDESGKLRRDELLYDEVFHIVKSFLDVSTHHTIEELQQFSNTRTPSAPWMYVMRARIPMSCCDDAAGYLIDVLGGEEKTRQIVGGTKWWQVRGVKGVDAQWIVARKDYQRIKKQRKQQEQQAEQSRRDGSMTNEEEAVYDPEIDDLRCILYFHGGGYYFGSVDQERFFIQRFARKSGCRLLAITYRLAPQYPFPCAIQDALASYLYLIRPPPGAPHTPVNPAHIIISGDSAGGGLTLALLQVLRDSGLPLPAGAIPISPWCDLAHSFPSIHLNTDTDVIPKYGLSIYKPSVLWPPPPDTLTNEVQAGIRTRIRQIAKQYWTDSKGDRQVDAKGRNEKVLAHKKSNGFWNRRFTFCRRDKDERSVSRGRSSSRAGSPEALADQARTGDVRAAAVTKSLSRQRTISTGRVEIDLDTGPSAPLPTPDETHTQILRVTAENGEVLEVHDQVHMYTPNNLLIHPLVSPAMGYLGGLPPILMIASDGEVLRDEIIYTAHKAAHPERYPVKPEVKRLCPKLDGIEERYGPTKVHLQVYDHAAHTFPVLFFVTNSANSCFRAMATFSKYVLGTLPIQVSTSPSSSSNETASLQRRSFRRSASLNISIPKRMPISGTRSFKRPSSSHGSIDQRKQQTNDQPRAELASQRTGSPARMSFVSSSSSTSEQVTSSLVMEGEVRQAGDPAVYLRHSNGLSSPFVDNMIRERVSTRGESRPLESESELAGCTTPLERIGVANELVLRRYIEGSTKWNERFAKAKEHISKRREQSLTLAKSEAKRIVPQLQMHFYLHADEEGGGGTSTIKEGLRQSAASWAWAWALDGAERPPPSSIVARRDTEEARRLSRIADLPSDTHDHRISGNNLWTYLVNRLSLEKSEAKVEQRSVERDPHGVGKDLSFDFPGTQKSTETEQTGHREKDGEKHASKERKRRPHWRRSLSRTTRRASSPGKRGSILRLKSAPSVRADCYPAQDSGNNVEDVIV